MKTGFRITLQISMFFLVVLLSLVLVPHRGPPANSSTAVPEPILNATATALPTTTPASATALPTDLPTASESDPSLIAVGDIICSSMRTGANFCQYAAVSDVAIAQHAEVTLVLGDLCHSPSAECLKNYYDPTWGRLYDRTFPVIGTHEYMVEHASNYFDYWNGAGVISGRAGDRDKGYYSTDLGAWHIIALNSQCSQAGGCTPGSPQYKWLEQDLKNNPAKCTLAAWHIPLFSSGGRANNNMKAIYSLLYNYNAEVVLTGHDHIYERFAPQDYNGAADPARGIREFVVGTGGANHTDFSDIQPNSEVRNNDSFGVLKLTLHADRYDWVFLPAQGMTFSDAGTGYCH